MGIGGMMLSGEKTHSAGIRYENAPFCSSKIDLEESESESESLFEDQPKPTLPASLNRRAGLQFRASE